MGQRLEWIDLAKVLAAVCVVTIHVVAAEILKEDFYSLSWQAANIIDSFCRFAPPLFFMVSGAMLLGKSEPMIDFYRKRVSKIFWPFIFWSFAFLTLRKFFSPVNPTYSELFVDLLKGEAYYHLWFINAILILYILTPLLRKIIAAIKPDFLFVLVSVLFVISSYGVFTNSKALFLFKTLGHIAYFLAGYLLLKIQYSKIASLIIVLLSGIVTAHFTLQASIGADELNLRFYEYTSPSVILMSIFLFLLLKNSVIRSELVGARLSYISGTTLGVYLIHPIILNKISMQWAYEIGYPVGVAVQAVAVLGISFACVEVIKKIKYLNKTV